MTKNEAIELFVQRDMQGIPTEWVRIVARALGEDRRFPMWGYMFLVDGWLGRRLDRHAATLSEADDAEMAGERQIAGTPAFLYLLDGRWMIGVHAAGWDFYDGVWDVLYDLLGLRWHDAARK